MACSLGLGEVVSVRAEVQPETLQVNEADIPQSRELGLKLNEIAISVSVVGL